MYYYLYYLLSRFAKRFNNRDGDFAFTAIFYFILLVGLNIITILIVFCDKAYFKTHISLMVFISTVIPIGIHYFALVRNKKYMEVIKKYNVLIGNSNRNKNIIIDTLYCIYIICTFGLVIYVAHHGRS